MAGQVAYHLLAQAGVTRAPWPVTTIVSCLPVLVLAMGTALAHMLRADAAADAPHSGTGGPALPRSPGDQDAGAGPRGPGRTGAGPGHTKRTTDRVESVVPNRTVAWREPRGARGIVTAPAARTVRPEIDQARLIARTLAAAGKPVSRRALRNGGVKGSNEALNALARTINAEQAGTEPSPGRT